MKNIYRIIFEKTILFEILIVYANYILIKNLLIVLEKIHPTLYNNLNSFESILTLWILTFIPGILFYLNKKRKLNLK